MYGIGQIFTYTESALIMKIKPIIISHLVELNEKKCISEILSTLVDQLNEKLIK